jgi:hypothetical protein
MDFNPPIKERTDKELFEIIENKKAWNPEAFNQAQSELIDRGISLNTQDNRKRSKKKYQSRISKIKSSSSYTSSEMVFIIILGWPLCLIFQDIGIFYSGGGFQRKNKQGLLAAFLGLLLWGFIIYLTVIFS